MIRTGAIVTRGFGSGIGSKGLVVTRGFVSAAGPTRSGIDLVANGIARVRVAGSTGIDRLANGVARVRVAGT